MLTVLLTSAALSLGQVAPPPALAAAAAPVADRWFLMRTLQGTWAGAALDDNRMQVTGWTDVSYTASSDRASNLPLGFNDRANQFLLQQNWLRIEREVVKDGTSTPTVGFRSDWILPGADYIFTLPRGIFNRQLTADNGQPNRYGIDPVQFYGEAYVPTVGQSLDVKVGRFFAPYGYESIAAVDNNFLSHAYGFIYDPFTQTGVLATLAINRAWTVQSGLTLGTDNFLDGPIDTPTYTGTAKWTSPGGRDTAAGAVLLGSGRFNDKHNFHNPEIVDFIYIHKVNARANYALECLYGMAYNVPGTGFASWGTVTNYLTVDLAPRLTGAARLEFFDDFQGERTGFAGLYSALTVGVQFRPWKGIILRPELRYDYNNQSSPFDGRHGLCTAASDLILRW